MQYIFLIFVSFLLFVIGYITPFFMPLTLSVMLFGIICIYFLTIAVAINHISTHPFSPYGKAYFPDFVHKNHSLLTLIAIIYLLLALVWIVYVFYFISIIYGLIGIATYFIGRFLVVKKYR